MPCPSHSPWLDHSNYTWRRVHVLKNLHLANLFQLDWVTHNVCSRSIQEALSAHLLPRPAQINLCMSHVHKGVERDVWCAVETTCMYVLTERSFN
jgi:hypothetical protein